MSKAEEFIQENTRNCSNEYLTDSKPDGLGGYISRRKFTPWLSIDEARKAVEIAMEEMMEDITIFLEGAHEYTDNKVLQMQYDNEGLIRDFREFVRNKIMKDE